MTYCITSNARKGSGLGVQKLFLVDRTKSKRLWWTSDNPQIIIKYKSLAAAEYALSRLNFNSPKIISEKQAVSEILAQARKIDKSSIENDRQSALDAMESGWDGHKQLV